MARRRREVQPESSEPIGQAEQLPEGPQPQIDVRMRGTADQVKRQLGVATEERAERPKEGNGHDDEKKKFVEALRNPKYIIRVKRMTPREFGGQKTNVEVWQAELPLDYQEIQTEIAKGFGGEKYRVAVVDPQSNSTIAADVFTIDGDPIIPESDMTQEEMDRVLMRGAPKTASDLTEEGLDRRARVSAKMLEVEALEAQLEDARKRRSSGSKDSSQDNTRIDELDRKLTEAKHQAELEARDRKHAEEMRELKALIAQQARPPQKDEANNTLTMLMEQMREDRKASQQQFNALLTQMKDEKLNAVLEEVKSIRSKPQQQTPMLEMAQAMLQMKKLFGWDSGGDDDEDDEDDANDDRPWWERAIDKLGGKFGDKFLDKLMEKFSGMDGKGEQVTREQFIKELQDEAQRVADEAVAKAKRQTLTAPTVNPPLPAPPPPQTRPAVSIPPAPVTSLPPPPPPSGPVGLVPPVSEPATQGSAPDLAQAPQKLTLEQEIVLRVGGVLEMIDREIELRPNQYTWNYEGCYLLLPESVLEKVCAAPDPLSMLDAFTIEHISPEAVAGIKAKLSANPRMMSWLKAGHDELKEWWTQKQADPKFDPFAEEEGEEE